MVTGIQCAGKRLIKTNEEGGSSANRRRRHQNQKVGEEEAPLPPKSMKWEVSNLMRLVEGALVLFVSFIFIIQSQEAIELWLNFAGVTFVGALDDAAFVLAGHNFFGVTAKKVADRVSHVQVYTKKSNTNSNSSNTILQRTISKRGKKLLFFGLVAGLWIALSIVQKGQADQKYSCRSVSIQVGDSDYHWARDMSGDYTRLDRKYVGRAVYQQRDSKEGYIIAYCSKGNNRWTVSPETECTDFTLVSHILVMSCSLIFIQQNGTK